MTPLQHNILVLYAGQRRMFPNWTLRSQEEINAFRVAIDGLVASGHMHQKGPHGFCVRSITELGRAYLKAVAPCPN